MGQHGPIGVETLMKVNRRQQKPAKRPRGAPEPRMPEGLTNEGRREWLRITRLLRDRGALDALDQAGLHDYLLCWERLRQCEAEIEARGVLVDGERGKVKNPACQLARQYRDALLAWAKELGFTMTSRTRMGIPKPASNRPNPFAKFDKRGGGETLNGNWPA